MKVKPNMIETPDLLPLKKICQEYINTIANEKYVDDDLSHYIFECALSTFFGREVWNFVNHPKDDSEEN